LTAILNTRLELLPEIVRKFAPLPVIANVPLFVILNSLPFKIIVCSELKSDENTIESLAVEVFVVVIASLKEQSASQTPSLVSAVFVTVNVVACAEIFALRNKIAPKKKTVKILEFLVTVLIRL
jgi:hypothetical protein